jgi:hypothetical protein
MRLTMSALERENGSDPSLRGATKSRLSIALSLDLNEKAKSTFFEH